MQNRAIYTSAGLPTTRFRRFSVSSLTGWSGLLTALTSTPFRICTTMTPWRWGIAPPGPAFSDRRGGGALFRPLRHRAVSRPAPQGLQPGEQRSQWLFITFREEAVLPSGEACMSAGPPPSLLPRLGSLSRDPALVRLAAEAAQELEGGEPDGEECARTLLAALLIRHGRLTRKAAASLSVGQPPEQRDDTRRCLERLRPVMEYLSGAYTQDLTVEELAARFYVNPTTLRKWFRGGGGCFSAGVSASGAHFRRLFPAAGTGLSVLDIAMEVGYRSSSSFNRHFLAECGCSPVEYRRSFPGKPA